MKKIEILTIYSYKKELENKKRLAEEKTINDSLITYQKKFNEGEISKSETIENKYVFLKLESENSKFRKNWLISVNDILEISQHSVISKIGYTSSYIVGISNFKGNVCTIIDMSILLNNKKSLMGSKSCILLRKNQSIALLWPKIEINNIKLTKVDMKDYKNDKFYEEVHFSKGCFSDEENNIWNELDVDKLLLSNQILDGSNLRSFI